MSFTPPPAAPPEAAAIPSRRLDSQEVFDVKTDTYLNWTATFRGWLATFREWVVTVCNEIGAAQTQVVAAAVSTSEAAFVALSAANFKGLWPGMSGPLNKPACVKNAGRFWMLLNNLQDVAESEPSGTSPDWTSLDAGTSVSQTLSEAAVVNSIAGVTYIIAASSVTVILPAPGTQAKGDGGGIRLAVAPDGTQVLDFNGNKYLGIAAGQRHIDLASFALNWQFENTTTVGYY